MKKMLPFLLLAVLLGAALGYLAFWAYKSFLSPESSSETSIILPAVTATPVLGAIQPTAIPTPLVKSATNRPQG